MWPEPQPTCACTYVITYKLFESTEDKGCRFFPALSSDPLGLAPCHLGCAVHISDGLQFSSEEALPSCGDKGDNKSCKECHWCHLCFTPKKSKKKRSIVLQCDNKNQTRHGESIKDYFCGSSGPLQVLHFNACDRMLHLQAVVKIK